jgi:hypothetical protein
MAVILPPRDPTGASAQYRCPSPFWALTEPIASRRQLRAAHIGSPDLPPGQRSRISWVRPERYGRSSLFDIPLPSVYPLGEVAVAARSNDVAVARLFDHLVSEREQRRWRAQRTTAICDSHSRISSTLRTYTLDTHCECQTGAALATSFGHTVTSSFLRHWTMIGTESMSSPV